mmetsp:Transcript_9941/g.16580  ORF Transcript_9941/g.16580 Transcript_9941/m.16580 type:complete len:90 (+) Transcript_9941:207-476(+)
MIVAAQKCPACGFAWHTTKQNTPHRSPPNHYVLSKAWQSRPPSSPSATCMAVLANRIATEKSVTLTLVSWGLSADSASEYQLWDLENLP